MWLPSFGWKYCAFKLTQRCTFPSKICVPNAVDSSDFFQPLNCRLFKLQTLIGFFIEKHSLNPGTQPEFLRVGEVLWNKGTSINLFSKSSIKKGAVGKNFGAFSHRNTSNYILNGKLNQRMVIIRTCFYKIKALFST